MSKSASTTRILVSAAILITILALAAFGCSVKGTIVGSTSTAGSSPSPSSSVADGSEGAGTTGTTRLVEGGKTAEEYAALIPGLEEAVGADPTDLVALQALAVAQYNTNQYEDAEATYLKMLQMQDEPMTRNNYANVLRDAGKTEQAKAEYEKALAADPTLTVAYLNLAVVYAGAKDVGEAKKVLNRGIAVLTGDDQKRLQTYKDKLETTTS